MLLECGELAVERLPAGAHAGVADDAPGGGGYRAPVSVAARGQWPTPRTPPDVRQEQFSCRAVVNLHTAYQAQTSYCLPSVNLHFGVM